MIKIIKWLKKKLHCLNYGHEYYYNKYADYFFCKKCGKVSKFPSWSKED